MPCADSVHRFAYDQITASDQAWNIDRSQKGKLRWFGVDTQTGFFIEAVR